MCLFWKINDKKAGKGLRPVVRVIRVLPSVQCPCFLAPIKHGLEALVPVWDQSGLASLVLRELPIKKMQLYYNSVQPAG